MLALNTVGAGQPHIHAPGLQESCRNKAWSPTWLQALWFLLGSRAARGGRGRKRVFPSSLALIHIVSVTLFTPPSYSLSRPSVWVLLRSRSVPRRVSSPSPVWFWTGVGSVTHGVRQAMASSKMMEGFLEKWLADLRCDINSVYVTCSFYLWVPDQVSTDASEICSH